MLPSGGMELSFVAASSSLVLGVIHCEILLSMWSKLVEDVLPSGESSRVPDGWKPCGHLRTTGWSAGSRRRRRAYRRWLYISRIFAGGSVTSISIYIK